MLNLRDIALLITVLHKNRKLVKKKLPHLLDTHMQTIDVIKSIFDKHVNTDKDLQDILIDEIQIADNLKNYVIQFLQSYLQQHTNKKSDPIYVSLSNVLTQFSDVQN